MNEKDFINKINQPRNNNSGNFSGGQLSDIHEKIMNRLKGNNQNVNQNQQSPINNKAELVMQSDMMLRESVKNLTNALMDLGDIEIAKVLIAEHIMILNEVFKIFEQ